MASLEDVHADALETEGTTTVITSDTGDRSSLRNAPPQPRHADGPQDLT